MSEKSSRERLESRLGFILISAGCAIGIGNVFLTKSSIFSLRF